MTSTVDAGDEAASEALPQALMRMRELAMSAACAAAVRAAGRLGLPDALDTEAALPETLAERVGADPDGVERLLRALSTWGVFAEDDAGRFSHTDMSRLIRTDTPRSMVYNALWATEPWTWELWPQLEEAVRAGGVVFERRHCGQHFFDWLHEPEQAESSGVFDKAMTQSSGLSATAIARELDLDGVRVVADIAGGQGLVLTTLLTGHPELRGVLQDLPGVVVDADPRLLPGGALADRVELVGEDIRVDVPVQADLYILKNILEWDDRSTVRTLRNVVRNAEAGARVVVIENLVDGSPEGRFTTAMDLLLLLNVGGKKHTREGMTALMEQAGLRVTTVRPLNSYLHLLEATVAP